MRIFDIMKLDIFFPYIYKCFFKYNLKNFIYEYWKVKKFQSKYKFILFWLLA